MATISIHDLNPVGYSLFADDESYLRDLSSDDELSVFGGKSSAPTIVTGTASLISITIVTITLATYSLYESAKKYSLIETDKTEEIEIVAA